MSISGPLDRPRSGSENQLRWDRIIRWPTYSRRNCSGNICNDGHDRIQVKEHENLKFRPTITQGSDTEHDCTHCCKEVRQESTDTGSSALPGANLWRRIYEGLRDEKVDQPVTEYKVNKFGPATSRERKFPASEAQDNEVEDHGINEANSKDLVVGVCDDTSALNPSSL